MSRSYRRRKRHLGKSTRLLGDIIYKSDKGTLICRLRHPKQYRQMLRISAEGNIRKKSIPPSANEDQWAIGKIQTAWR